MILKKADVKRRLACERTAEYVPMDFSLKCLIIARRKPMLKMQTLTFGYNETIKKFKILAAHKSQMFCTDL